MFVAAASVAADGGGSMKITSEEIYPNSPIRVRYTCDGDNISPAFGWSGVPDGTVSFAIVMDDPDAPAGTWVHWVLFNLPGNTAAIGGNTPEVERLLSGAVHGASWGVDEFTRIGYHGPCPPPGKPHRYFFRVYALDTILDLGPGASKADVLKAAEGHILAVAELMGTYAR
jgi:Raf kinase inhibitor-like YbhB/YbcL family protein